MKKLSFVQGQVLQGGTTLAPLGRPAPTWPSLSSDLSTLQLRAEHLKASALSILRSEGFSIAVGFVMSVLMMALLWFTCNIFY